LYNIRRPTDLDVRELATFKTINWQRIFAAAPKGGLQSCFVPPDFCERPPLESIKMSFDDLKMLAV
jgi:hypothetical protein